MGIFLLGAAPGIAEKAGEQLRKRYPHLKIAGTYAGSPHPAEEEEICQRIKNSQAEILLVAYGAPKQELWLSRNLDRLPLRLAMCVGGSFDFLAGITPRAPKWMQVLGIEWLYRLIQEPRRWRRMLALPKFAVLVIVERILLFFKTAEI
jgi:N-acetylglucosaminyldiphosphoundecaprenol N-acetyl-beta-D-mannosaminyltransferase